MISLFELRLQNGIQNRLRGAPIRDRSIRVSGRLRYDIINHSLNGTRTHGFDIVTASPFQTLGTGVSFSVGEYCTATLESLHELGHRHGGMTAQQDVDVISHQTDRNNGRSLLFGHGAAIPYEKGGHQGIDRIDPDSRRSNQVKEDAMPHDGDATARREPSNT